MKRNWLGAAFVLGLVACSSGKTDSGASRSLPSDSNDSTSTGSGGGTSSSGASGGELGGPESLGSSSGGSGGGDFAAGGGAGLATGGSSAAAIPPSGGDAGGYNLPAPGQLTAGIWDDALNFSFFTSYLAAHSQVAGDPGFALSDYTAAQQASAQRSPRTVVDAALVIDTTGSMGDELAYLDSEFAGIVSAVSAKFPNASQRWALVVYRDTPDYDPNDGYVVQSFDFTSDMTAFGKTVGAQQPGNGGDYPESPELGLEALPQLTWRTDPSVAKLAFWVADAPHHVERAGAMKKAILDAQTAGVHLYPVSASGSDELLELTMRSAAELTGGRYLFLTDDSGIGGTHMIPEIPCYFVTTLAKDLTRVVSMELSGQYAGPDPADVIRISGNASGDGTCSVEGSDGGTVQIF